MTQRFSPKKPSLESLGMNGTVASPADRRSAPRNDPDLLPPDERDDMHLALRSIVEGTATATGTEFFYALVLSLIHI